jgi:uncharacterized protein (TIGR03435 family)
MYTARLAIGFATMSMLSCSLANAQDRSPQNPPARGVVAGNQAQGSGPKVGDAAPALSVDGVLGDARGLGDPASLNAWRGRAIVLEFSAGWCGPCRATTPHMNELVEKFKNDAGVAFLTVTNEGKAAAEKFRSDVKMASALAYDADGSTYESYRIRGVPSVFLIDRAGKVVARGHPADLTPEVLGALVRGEPVTLKDYDEAKEGKVEHAIDWNMGGMSFDPDSLKKMLADQKKADRLESVEDAVAYAILRKAAKAPHFLIGGEEQRDLRERGMEPIFLAAVCYGFDPDDIEDRAGLPEDAIYDLYVRSADSKIATARQIGRRLLEETFGFTTRTEERVGRVKKLRRLADAPPLPTPGAGDGEHTTSAGNFDSPEATSRELADYLRQFVNAPVIDETGLKGNFGLKFSWDLMVPVDEDGGLIDALRGKGFELVDGEGPVRRLIIEKRE